jgi:hypothetical protein
LSNGRTLKRVWLADATGDLGISFESLVEKVAAGDLRAIGRQYDEGWPQFIPPEHFILPLREHHTLGPDDLAAHIQLGYVPPGTELSAIPMRSRWVDPDTGEEWLGTVRPPSCIDRETNMIYLDGEPTWTDIQIILSGNASGQAIAARKAVDYNAYEKYQRDRKERTGYWASQTEEEIWAGNNGYSVESVRSARKTFREEKLTAAEAKKFSIPGRRRGKKPAP